MRSTTFFFVYGTKAVISVEVAEKTARTEGQLEPFNDKIR